MEFDNSFEVPLPPAQAWPVLMNIQGIAPCMPGAQLTEVVDDKTYKGNIAVRLGPVALTFAGLVKFEEIDDANHTARVRAQGTDAKFANNLKKQLASPAADAAGEAADGALPAAAKPISATSLAGQVVWNSIKDKLGGKS